MHPDLYRLLIALGIGAIIGAEREYRSKSAGLRTMIMVSLSSCLFTIMSLKIGVDSHDRIAANILTGLGFVGAGVIFKDENRISGITTATTIWMTAALGMAAGAGYEMLSLFATFIVLIVLIFLIYVQEKIEALSQARTYRIICPYQRKILDQYEALFKTYNMKVVRSVQHKTEHRMSGRWILIGSAENHKKLTAYLLNDSNIQELGF
ncbi:MULTISPECIES: MgtC/SapB family protein [unclassified Acinetobacter]|jgi:putative Mg2+ transporter-C (MgtC) family protein|uniref:MgtC/SapB family protein n=1 Tax=unclassified Acinetobacter TaxID=196816 RepID=UPI0021B84626|nr:MULTISPECIES: MgtC/SapB family protein [unclassified Acinetobacter]MCT8089638.1 MgtC/SapB family protein [Acinetobacter sp. F_3_1]MCT8099070.1 MgtC/SapB family protein [Acinetobacter sp. C_3_1]MCT8101887.1 MgtC/SapB family protein [Acinetobacter sp. C_4_1]MCT8134916.1 MgtC/SapB family protein [Acinetobacter sp. T_3_1]